MTMLAKEQLFPYDVSFFDDSSRIGASRAKLDAAPIDYGRLGGMALQRRGDMYGALFNAAQQASGNRSAQEMNRRISWNEAAARKRALADKIRNQAIANYAKGGIKIAGQVASDIAHGDEDFRSFLTENYSGRFDPKTGSGRF